MVRLTTLLLVLAILAYTALSACVVPKPFPDLHDYMLGRGFDPVKNVWVGERRPCQCQITCTFDRVIGFKQSCRQNFDQCDPTSNCTAEICDGPLTASCEDVNRHCTNDDVDHCHCCVKPIEWFTNLCIEHNGMPPFSSPCGDICELCSTLCDIPVCRWLTNVPPIGHPYSQKQIDIIRAFIAIWLNNLHLDSCLPIEIEAIWMKIGTRVWLEKDCPLVDITDAELLLLQNYLNGLLPTAPPCPADPPPTPVPTPALHWSKSARL